MSVDEELKLLNRQTFKAEEKPQGTIEQRDWKTFLQDVLAANFSIKRHNGAVQNKQEMIEFIEDGDPQARNIIEETVKPFTDFRDEDFGVVTSVITVGTKTTQYHNIKVFSRRPPGSWRCVYWETREIS
jgi:hypothetical protein